MDRRLLVQSLPSFLIASSVPSLTTPALAAKAGFPAALLVAKSRPHAALGRSMERAAMLVGTGFKAICGNVRFREDGSATRALAILAVSNGGLRSVAGPGGA